MHVLSASMALLLGAACGGSSPVGPSTVAAAAPVAAPQVAAAPRPVPSWVSPELVGTLLLVDAEGWPKRWEAGRPLHFCFHVSEAEAAAAEAVSQRVVALTGIPRTEAGPCNFEWFSEPGVAHTYTDAHGSDRAIVYAAVHLYAANSMAVMLHEAGHALGLGHSSDPEHLMYANGYRARDFTPTELAVLAWLYAPNTK